MVLDVNGDKRLTRSVTLLEIFTTISSHDFAYTNPLPDPDHKHHWLLRLPHTANGWMDGWMDGCTYVSMYVYMYVCMYVRTYGMRPIQSSNNLNTFVKDTQA